MQNDSYRLTACLLAISIGLAACGKSDGKKEASQVAAKVNGAEISIYQINQALAHTPGVTDENAGKARKDILEKLILQELAVAKATEAKLDRTPDIIMTLEASRRDILTRAYFNQLAGAAQNVPEEDVKRYYNEHPELFSQRRIYSITDIAFPRDEKLVPPLRELIARGKPMQEIARWLKENGVGFNEQTETRAAGQLPLELLPRIAKLKDGQTDIIETGTALHVINLVNSKQEPINIVMATPQIQVFLGAQRAQLQISEEMKKLRQSAKVEYLGEFAAGKNQETSNPAPTAIQAPPPAASPSAASPALDASIVKGVAGSK